MQFLQSRKARSQPLKTREIIRLIKDDEWRLDGQKGSHMQFVHPTKPGKVTIPFHGNNEDIPPYLVASILKQAGLR